MSNEISTNVNEAPAFLQNFDGDTGTESLKRFVLPQYLKIVKDDTDLAEKFELGSVVMMPTETLLMGPKETVTVVPVFCWFQWELWYDYYSGAPEPVKERTLDPSHEIAQICMNGNPKDWKIPDEEHEGHELTYKEVICYFLWVEEHEKFICVNFSGGEHKTGRNFSAMIRSRGTQMPIYAGKYTMTVGVHTDKAKKNKWKGFDFNNAGWIDEAQFQRFQENYEEFKDKHENLEIILKETEDVAEETKAENRQQF